MKIVRSCLLGLALIIPVLGFAFAVYRFFNPISYGGEFNFFPGLRDGLPVFVRSCLTSAALILIYFSMRAIKGLWSRGSIFPRFLCFVICYVLIFAAYMTYSKYPKDFPF